MSRHKAGAKILFKTDSNEELQFFLELVQKIIKEEDSIVETKLNSISIRLYGKKEDVENIAKRLKDGFGLVKSAFLIDVDGRRHIDISLLGFLTGYHVDSIFFSSLLTELEVGEGINGKIIRTSLRLKDLLERYKQAHLTFISVLPAENKDVRKLVTILKILFPKSQTADIISFGIERQLFELREGKLIFRAEKKKIIEIYKKEFVVQSRFLNEIQEEKQKIKGIIDGGKIIFKNKTKP